MKAPRIRTFSATNGFDDYIAIIKINRYYSEVTLKTDAEDIVKGVKSYRCKDALSCIRTLVELFNNNLKWHLA